MEGCEGLMATSKKPVEAATADPGESRAVSPPAATAPLAKASESGDGEVQKLLGDRETARRNLEAARLQGVADPDAEASAAAVTARLAELGYE